MDAPTKFLEFNRNYKYSWVKYYEEIPEVPLRLDAEAFQNLWDTHPVEQATIKLFGKEYLTPRWQQSYGVDYKFSGVTHKALPIPPVIQKYIDYMNWVESQGETGQPHGPYNMALVNWYQDGSHYISPHSDNEPQIVKGSSVACFSFGQPRNFEITSKPHTKIESTKDTILLANNSLVIMGGSLQETHNHSIPKITRKAELAASGPRISITLRKFK